MVKELILKTVFFVPYLIYKGGEHAYQNSDVYRRAGTAIKDGALALPGHARALSGMAGDKTIGLAKDLGNAYLSYKKATIPLTLTGVSPVGYGGYQGYVAHEGQGVEAFVGNTSMAYQTAWSYVPWGASKTVEILTPPISAAAQVANDGVDMAVNVGGNVIGESAGYVAGKTGNLAVKIGTPIFKASMQAFVDGAIHAGREFKDFVIENTPKSVSEVRDLCYTAPENRQGGAEKLIEEAIKLKASIIQYAPDLNNLPETKTVVLIATAVATAVGLGYAAYRYKKSIEKVEDVAAGVITPAKPETLQPSNENVDGVNVEGSDSENEVNDVETKLASIATSTQIDEATIPANDTMTQSDEPTFEKEKNP